MRPIGKLSLLAALLPLTSLAQSPAIPAANTFSSEALVFEHFDTTYRMHADGTGERDLHVVLRIQSGAAVQQFGLLSFPYASAYESPLIKFIRVHKTDGSTVETPTSDAIDMSSEVSRQAPLYSDLKEKHIPVRSLSVGDTLEYEIDTLVNKAEAPGQFWGAHHFTPPGTIIVLSETLTLEVPAEKYVQVWGPNHKPTSADHDDLRTYTWTSSQLTPAPRRTPGDTSKLTPPKDPDEDADGRKIPSVAWTTFRSWPEVGDWYRSLALAQSAPTDALRARANEITANATTPDDQIRALYNFVSGHARYIGIDFGIGRYQPHSAAEVLANQYGDCKDKDTLLEALLRAKGFSTAPALIGAGVAPVPDVPSPAVFNHVITTISLPSGRIWLDSTPGAAPYRLLSTILRDQKALVIPADGPASLVTTPAETPYPFTARFEAQGALEASGKLTAKMTASYRNDDELIVRMLAHSIAPAEWDKASQYISANTGFGGTTSNTQFVNVDDDSQPILLKYDYTRSPFGDWDSLRIVPLFPALEFSNVDQDSAPDDDIQLGAPRKLVALSHIKLPDGYRADLPDPVHVTTDFATFDKTYRFDGHEITAERTIVILKRKLPKDDWKRYRAFTKDINLSGESWIQLIAPSKSSSHHETITKTIPVKPVIERPEKGNDKSVVVKIFPPQAEGDNAPSSQSSGETSASMAELLSEAQTHIRSQDWAGARDTLDRIKAKNPNQIGLWSLYAFLAEVADHNDEEAKADFRKEIALEPDNSILVGALANVENRTGQTSEARQTLQNFLAGHPDNLALSFNLSALQTQAADYAGALKTLEAAAEQNPDNRIIRIQIAESLYRLNRPYEAAAAAKSALDGVDDPGILNDAAYVLSEANSGLDIAESASRKSIDALDKITSSITAAEANTRAFGQSQLLVAAWDTLGWILYQEGKYDDAGPWLNAAWRASLRAEIGDHIGQLDEATDKKDAAVTAYTLAQGAIDKNVSPDVRNHILSSLQRLKMAGAKPGPANVPQALQDLRTYKVARPDGASGWGAFRFEIANTGVLEAIQMSGEKHLEALKPTLTAMKFPDLLPPGSKAHLLRSAVVSCSLGNTCEVVFVPDGGLQTESQ